ncbi:uncharacterized protein LOC111260470 isoform X2 [Varroa jacobsoni]|uniref:uncharacterized protein LOC111260470 isoform X2 n=1 Tax=Varroa jacobsoni TaxID=62625 RepID=UPI000BF41C72|nr:uncharacterized protein LOC111260470 isoform X2 [Varroa jacobsoni]
MESRRSSTATMAPSGDEFLRSMAQIRDKLRKRFLRKPLYLDAAHSYELLAVRELQLEFPEGAAMAWNAAADVYTNIRRLGAAAENYTKAARTYMKEELNLKKLCMPSIEDHLINGLECYHRAICTYEKIAEVNKGSEGMAGSLCYEAGSKLQQLERFGESLWFLERACQKWPESTVLKVECFLLLAKSQVKLSEFESAEITFHELDSLINAHMERASLEHTHQQVFLTLKAILECCKERCFEKMSQHYDILIEFCDETSRLILDELVKTVCPYHC